MVICLVLIVNDMHQRTSALDKPDLGSTSGNLMRVVESAGQLAEDFSNRYGSAIPPINVVMTQ